MFVRASVCSPTSGIPVCKSFRLVCLIILDPLCIDLLFPTALRWLAATIGSHMH